MKYIFDLILIIYDFFMIFVILRYKYIIISNQKWLADALYNVYNRYIL